MHADDRPRVLFVTPCAFNDITGGGVTFSNLFRGWPRERLATVTSDPTPVSRDVCDRYYFLSTREIRLLPPFRWLLQQRQMESGASQAPAPPAAAMPPRPAGPLRRAAARLLGDTGIPEQGRLSDDLVRWIDDYQPQVLYTILGSLGLLDLVTAIQRRWNLPLAVHLMDEGAVDPRLTGAFAPFIRLASRRRIRRLLTRAALCMAICPDMAAAYGRRYGRTFLAFQNPVDLLAWQNVAKQPETMPGTTRLVYAGSLHRYAQLTSLMDCCRAAQQLVDAGARICLDIYTPLSVYGAASRLVSSFPCVRVHDVVDRDQFEKNLVQADVLLLPVNFDWRSVHFVRLSMPTKLPEYLASRTPILVYGPAGLAQVEYAREHGWGLVVDQQSPDLLREALAKLIGDGELRAGLREAAQRTVRAFHDAAVVRPAFQDALCRTVIRSASICGSGSPAGTAARVSG